LKPKSEVVIRSFGQFRAYVKKWAEHDWSNEPRTLVNKRHIRRKTAQQNGAIHVLIRRLAEHTGDEEEYLKNCFKEQFGPKRVAESGPFKGTEVCVSVGDYNTEEASAMIEKILYVAADFYGVYLEIEK